MFRSACITLAALAVIGTTTLGAALAQDPPAQARRAPGGVQVPQLPDRAVTYATTSFNCTNRNGSVTTYTLSVEGGSCLTQGNTPTSAPNAGACRNNGSGDNVSANCSTGCGRSDGTGSCTQTTTPR